MHADHPIAPCSIEPFEPLSHPNASKCVLRLLSFVVCIVLLCTLRRLWSPCIGQTLVAEMRCDVSGRWDALRCVLANLWFLMPAVCFIYDMQALGAWCSVCVHRMKGRDGEKKQDERDNGGKVNKSTGSNDSRDTTHWLASPVGFSDEVCCVDSPADSLIPCVSDLLTFLFSYSPCRCLPKLFRTLICPERLILLFFSTYSAFPF